MASQYCSRYLLGECNTKVIHQRIHCQSPLWVIFGLAGATENARMRNADRRECTHAMQGACTTVNLCSLLAGNSRKKACKNLNYLGRTVAIYLRNWFGCSSGHMENKQMENSFLCLYSSYQEKIKCCQSFCQLTAEPFSNYGFRSASDIFTRWN